MKRITASSIPKFTHQNFLAVVIPRKSRLTVFVISRFVAFFIHSLFSYYLQQAAAAVAMQQMMQQQQQHMHMMQQQQQQQGGAQHAAQVN